MVLIALFAASCVNLQAPVTEYKKYEIKNISLTKADIVFVFDIDNPNSIPLSIRDIDYNLQLNGSGFVSGTFEGFSLNAKEKKTVSIPVQIKYADLVGQAVKVAQKFISRSGNITYRLDGNLLISDNVGTSAKVPIAAEGEIKFY